MPEDDTLEALQIENARLIALLESHGVEMAKVLQASSHIQGVINPIILS